MFAKVTCKVWSGNILRESRIKDTTNGTVFLMNGNRINGLKVRATTKSKFMFVDNLHDYREKAAYVEAEESNATITTDMDKTWNSTVMILNFYPDNDITKTVVATRVNCESVGYVYKDVTNPGTKSWVVYYEGGKRRELLCDYSINQIYALADNGGLTTA